MKKGSLTLQVSRPSLVEGHSVPGVETPEAAEVAASRQQAHVVVSAPHPAFVSCYDYLGSLLAGSHQTRYQRLASKPGRSKRFARGLIPENGIVFLLRIRDCWV